MSAKAKEITEKQLINFTRQLHNITCSDKTAVTDLANKSGITEGTIKNILEGGTPSLDNAIAICQGLNVTLGFMLNEKNDLYTKQR